MEIDFLNLQDTLMWFTGAGVIAWYIYVSDLIRNLRTKIYSETDTPLAYGLSQRVKNLTSGKVQVIVLIPH